MADNSQLGRNRSVATAFINTGSTNIGLVTQVQVLANLASASQGIEVFNSTGSTFAIYVKRVNTTASTLFPYTIAPAGSSAIVPGFFGVGDTIYLLALDTAATTGVVVMNFFQPIAGG